MASDFNPLLLISHQTIDCGSGVMPLLAACPGSGNLMASRCPTWTREERDEYNSYLDKMLEDMGR